MKRSRLRSLHVLALLAIVGGCGDGNPEDEAGEEWLEAPDALAMYLADPELMTSGRNAEGCPAVIDRIRGALEGGASTLGTRQILGVCSTAGMEFGGEVRCEESRLQVRCR